MANIQRTKNDTATTDRREVEDKTRKENRIKNDKLTIERREKEDKAMGEQRIRNDELTANRRDKKDANPSRDLAILLLILVVLAFGLYIIFT